MILRTYFDIVMTWNKSLSLSSCKKLDIPQLCPGQTYAPTGTSLGEDGVANNALVLMENRLAMEVVGDESGTCSDGFAPPTMTTTTTTTSAPEGH